MQRPACGIDILGPFCNRTIICGDFPQLFKNFLKFFGCRIRQVILLLGCLSKLIDHLVQPTATGDCFIFAGIECIERDIDPAHPSLYQRLRLTGQLGAIGRQDKLVKQALLLLASEGFNQSSTDPASNGNSHT